jgi:hypothetical protein
LEIRNRSGSQRVSAPNDQTRILRQMADEGEQDMKRLKAEREER